MREEEAVALRMFFSGPLLDDALAGSMAKRKAFEAVEVFRLQASERRSRADSVTT